MYQIKANVLEGLKREKEREGGKRERKKRERDRERETERERGRVILNVHKFLCIQQKQMSLILFE